MREEKSVTKKRPVFSSISAKLVLFRHQTLPVRPSSSTESPSSSTEAPWTLASRFAAFTAVAKTSVLRVAKGHM